MTDRCADCGCLFDSCDPPIPFRTNDGRVICWDCCVEQECCKEAKPARPHSAPETFVLVAVACLECFQDLRTEVRGVWTDERTAWERSQEIVREERGKPLVCTRSYDNATRLASDGCAGGMGGSQYSLELHVFPARPLPPECEAMRERLSALHVEWRKAWGKDPARAEELHQASVALEYDGLRRAMDAVNEQLQQQVAVLLDLPTVKEAIP